MLKQPKVEHYTNIEPAVNVRNPTYGGDE